MNLRSSIGMMLLSATISYGQQAQKKPFQQQSQSTIAYRNANNADAVEIQNVAYELVGPGISGRPKDERLVLRKTMRTKQVVDEIGMEASTTVEAWPLGVDPREKPLYTVSVSGVDPVVMNNDLIIVSRGLEEVEWWSAYRLGNGQRLFDSYTPIVQFSTTRDTQTL